MMSYSQMNFLFCNDFASLIFGELWCEKYLNQIKVREQLVEPMADDSISKTKKDKRKKEKKKRATTITQALNEMRLSKLSRQVDWNGIYCCHILIKLSELIYFEMNYEHYDGDRWHVSIRIVTLCSNGQGWIASIWLGSTRTPYSIWRVVVFNLA